MPSADFAKILTSKPFSLPGRLVTVIEFAAVTLIWGSTWLIIKGQLGQVPAVWSVAYRFILASIVLALFTVISGRWQRPTLAGHGFAAVVGVAQFALNFNLVYAAETRLTSGLVALIFALLIVPNSIFAAIFLKMRLKWRFVAGALLGIAGLVLVFAPDLANPVGHRNAAAGVLLVGCAVVCASIGNVMQASRLGRALPSLPTLTLSMTYGAIANVVVAATVAGFPVWDSRPEYWLGLGYLSILASVIAFSIYYRLIRRIGPGPAAYTSVLIPVIALLLSTLFENYHWTWNAALGAGLALFGVFVALSGRISRQDTPASPLDSFETQVRSQVPAALDP